MALEHGHHEGHHDAHHHHGPRALPTVLAAPDFVRVWQTRVAIVGVVGAVLSILAFAWNPNGREHLMRAYLMGFMMCFNFCGGALALLMVQYLSGGKWGLILRRPLEAMTRTIGLVIVMMIPVFLFAKHLYLYWAYPNQAATLQAYQAGLITQEQQLCMNLKHAMLSPASSIVQAIVVLGFMYFVITMLNKWSLQRDLDPAAGTAASYDRWRVTFENLAGPSTLLYVILMTAFVITFLKALDVTWYSSIYGLQLLVGQGYAVLALGIFTLIVLSRYEPIKTMFRTTEQHDLGKLAFAFTMLNIYLTFAEFLIIWSGNLPDEMPWYLNRIRGGWWMFCSLDVICHWLIPFVILLSRDFKRSKKRMFWLCLFMLFARAVDMFWLTEPNFRDAAGNLHLAGNFGILAYITVPITLISLWMVVYLRELGKRPLLNVNDPHTEELLEPEHAH